MVRVLPGVELTCASFCPSRELIKLDLPTFERPRKANSGGPSRGKAAGSAADVMNLARTGFKEIVCHAERSAVSPLPFSPRNIMARPTQPVVKSLTMLAGFVTAPEYP